MSRRWPALVLALVLTGFEMAAAAAEPIAPQSRTEYAEVLKVEPIYQTLRAFSTEEQCEPPRGAAENGRPSKCRLVRIPREFRRIFAYDVDYIHRGVKYRSRMPYDPGKRLQVKVSVMPVIEGGPRR